MSPITTVLFDLDGTLIDSVRLILDSYHHTLATHALPARSDEYWLAGLGTPLTVQFAEWAQEPAMLAQLVATYREFNMSQHDARVQAYPGVAELMARLQGRGLATGLVTSKNRAGAERGLRVCGLLDHFAVLVCADDVTRPKPDPEPVLKALAALGADPAGALYVGDSRHDMESGRAAGVRTAAALWGPFDRDHLAPTEPDHWLEHPADLATLVGA